MNVIIIALKINRLFFIKEKNILVFVMRDIFLFYFQLLNLLNFFGL